MTELRRRPLWGAAMGVLLGTVLVLFLAARGRLFGYDALNGAAVRIQDTLAMYLLGGAIGGALFGWLLPYTRRRLGAALVGMVVVTPFYVLQGVIEGSGPTSEAVGWWITVVLAVVVGGLAGYLIRDSFHRDLDGR